MSSEAVTAMGKSRKSGDDDTTTKLPPLLSKSDPHSANLHPVKVQSNDIIFGRGKGYHGHEGNARMRRIVDKYKIQYHAIDRSQKRQLVEVVYEEIIQDGAHFLVKASSSDGYVKADRIMALQKVSNALRCKKSFQRDASGASSPAKRKDPSLRGERDGIAGLASRPLHEGLSSPIRGAGGLVPLEPFLLPNNHSNLYASSLLPWRLRTPSLRGDVLPTMGIDTGGLSSSATIRSDYAASQEQARRNVALGIPNPSSWLYATTPASLQPSLDHVALLRQELLLQQLRAANIGSTRLAGGSIANDLSNRLLMENLLGPSLVGERNTERDKNAESKDAQRKDPRP
ncbi:MAG: hypothetical protein SGBAC_008289 [Bacillariaceae sp.]